MKTIKVVTKRDNYYRIITRHFDDCYSEEEIWSTLDDEESILSDSINAAIIDYMQITDFSDAAITVELYQNFNNQHK